MYVDLDLTKMIQNSLSFFIVLTMNIGEDLNPNFKTSSKSWDIYLIDVGDIYLTDSF